MNIPLGRWYRLVTRGGAGLACDIDGVALGVVDLARTRLDARGMRRCDVRTPGEIGEILRAAYGPQSDEVVLNLHRDLRRTAAWIEAGDLCRAGIKAVLLGFPDLTSEAMAKLAEIGDLEKDGAAWEIEPRIPAGQTGGGQWTTDGGGAPMADVRPAGVASPEGTRRKQLALPLDDGVYRPGVGHPLLIPVGGAEEGEEPRRGSNGPPDDFTYLQEVFPGFKDAPGLAIPLAPSMAFWGSARPPMRPIWRPR